MLLDYKPFKKYSLTKHDEHELQFGRIPDSLKGMKNRNEYLFVRKNLGLDCYTVYTITKNVPIYHGYVHDSIVDILTIDQLRKRFVERTAGFTREYGLITLFNNSTAGSPRHARIPDNFYEDVMKTLA